MPATDVIPAFSHPHFVGAGGIATAGLSVALKKRFPRLTASDEEVLPPADGILARGGVAFFDGYRAENVGSSVDLAILAPSIGRGNPELESILHRGIPCLTWPAALPKLGLLARHNGVVAGTDGKTTTACMWAWVLQRLGYTPDHVIGGQIADWESGVRLEGAEHCVLEGDEYPCGFEDPRPKFLHYSPEIVVWTNVHFDHPDAYRNTRALENAFARLRDLLPPDGLLVMNADEPRCRKLAAAAPCPVIGFGFSRHATARLTRVRCRRSATHFLLEGREFTLPQAGRMNAANAAAVALACRHWGISLESSARALADFPGANGRQAVLREDDNLVLLSDTAYHPNAVRHLLRALRDRYRGRRIGLVLQPRHTSGPANWQQMLWPRVLAGADVVLLTDPLNPHGDTSNRFCSDSAARQAAAKGANVLHVGPPEAAGETFDKVLRRGDVWVLCLADWFEQPRRGILESASAFS